MKNFSIKFKAIVSAFCIAMVRSSAQSGTETNAEALKFSHEIESKISDFEVNASDFETNESILESQKAIDKDMGGVENSLRSAIVTLHFSQINVGRKQRTILWFEIFAAIDRHLGRIPGVDIWGHIRPPKGYKGRMGIDGMEMPDTNDVADYKYYMAARRANRKNAMNGIFQNTLHGENDDEAVPYAEKFFQSSYTSEVDRREFKDLLEHSMLSDARKKALTEAVIGAEK